MAWQHKQDLDAYQILSSILHYMPITVKFLQQLNKKTPLLIRIQEKIKFENSKCFLYMHVCFYYQCMFNNDNFIDKPTIILLELKLSLSTNVLLAH